MAAERDWITLWLSSPRWNIYLSAANNNPAQALKFYEWNLGLASAIMHDIAHIEVGLRNVYNQTITARFDTATHWLFDPDSPVRTPLLRKRHGKTRDLNHRNRESIDEARRRIRSLNPSPGQVIAELSFGFWRHLTNTAHEKTLWVPYLNHAFPRGTSRKNIERSLQLINEVRNRASHHEPLFTPARRCELLATHNAIIDIARMLIPELAKYIEATSTLHDTLQHQPHPAG